jgi:hypothetical protein
MKQTKKSVSSWCWITDVHDAPSTERQQLILLSSATLYLNNRQVFAMIAEMVGQGLDCLCQKLNFNLIPKASCESCASSLGKNVGSVFESVVLWKIFGPKTDEVTQGWSKLHNVELHNLYHWLNVIRIIKSSIMRGESGHLAKYWIEERCIHYCGGDAWRRETTCMA